METRFYYLLVLSRGKLLHTLSGVALVPEELGAHTLSGHLPEALSHLDTVSVSLPALVVVGVVLGFGHYVNY